MEAEPEDYDGIIARLNISGSSSGPLSGLTFAAKDLFDIKGLVTGAGNPDWLATHSVAEETAPAVQKLLDAGASLAAKTCCDELAYSLDGINVHYGTPINPQDPDRIPGGSSSGSASVTAAGLVDIGLGTDTGGSIRVPASYCGLYSFRPTIGSISLLGVTPLAPAFDTVGWFARRPDLLELCGSVLLGEPTCADKPVRLCIVEDAFDLINESFVPVLKRAVSKIADRFTVVQNIVLSPDEFETWARHYRDLQSWQAWQSHGQWITESQPKFAPSVRGRFDYARSVTKEQMKVAYEGQRQIADFLSHLMRGAHVVTEPGEWSFPETNGATVLCMPAACNIAPLKMSTAEQLLCNRALNMRLTCTAGLGGLPQVTVPVKVTRNHVMGLSFLAARGADMMLLNMAKEFAALSVQ